MARPGLALALCATVALQVSAATPRAVRKPPAPLLKPPASPARPLPTLLDGAQALEPFFRALDRLASAPSETAPPLVVRVLHFGDSHTSADMWTGRLRARLQARFGDAGPGLLLPARPWRGFAHAGVDLDFGRKWPATSLRDPNTDGLVGLTGAALMVPEEEALQVRGWFRGFEITTLGSGAGAGPGVGLVRPDMTPAAPGWFDTPAPGSFPECAPTHTAMPLANGAVLHINAQRGLMAEESLELRVHLPAGDRLLGVDLYSGRSGLLYDELGLNGAEVTDLLRWNDDLRRLLLERAHPDLIVLAYGTNEMGRSGGALADYPEQVKQILETLASESGAPILVIGPLDRGARRTSMARYLTQSEPRVNGALRTVALAAGAAFWDARAAMGGAGSIARWQRQGLAQRDLVHLTGRGYQRLADLMADAILAAFDAFRAPQASQIHAAAPGGPP